ncbi:hypothetical protein N7527_005668 [Penicillium freii]|nr:hypothetical protein N7527_005668 [Penicillium freii]
MGDAEDANARITEANPIHFEWTPELVKIGTSRGDIHPSIGPHKFQKGYRDYTYRPNFQAPSCGYDNKVSTEGFSDITFPWIEGMVDLFIRGVQDDKEDDYDYTTHKGYIEKGIQLGLRPEFAIFCGLHETDPRAIDEPYLFEELWFTIKSPHSAIDETIIPFWMQLKEFMGSKLLYEGKAWSNYGR